MKIGILKWVDKFKGYGVISTIDKGEYFLHEKNSLKVPISELHPGIPLCFKSKIDKNKLLAIDCNTVKEFEDLNLALSYIDKEVPIIVEMQDNDFLNLSFKRKKRILKISLVRTSLEHIKRNAGEDQVIQYLKQYYDKGLNYEHFIKYCELIEELLSQPQTKDLFIFFGKKSNKRVAYEVWEAEKYKYLGKDSELGLEINKETLLKFKEAFKISDLKKIKSYSFCNELTYEIIKRKLSGKEKLLWDPKEFKKIVTSISEVYSLNVKYFFDEYSRKKIKEIINLKLNYLGRIDSKNKYYLYSKLRNIIPEELNQNVKEELLEYIEIQIVKNTDEDYKLDIWLEGVAINVTNNEIKFKFELDKTSDYQRVKILGKVNNDLKFKLIEGFFIKFRPKRGYSLIENLIKDVNDLTYRFKLSVNMFNNEFWKDKKEVSTLEFVKSLVSNITSQEENFELFFLGFSNIFPKLKIEQNILKLSRSEIQIVANSEKCNNEFLLHLLKTYMSRGTFLESTLNDINRITRVGIYNLADKHLEEQNFRKFDKYCFENLTKSDYLELWKKGYGKIFPENQVVKLFEDMPKSLEILKKWKTIGTVNLNELTKGFYQNLSNISKIENRADFYLALYNIRALLECNQNEKINLERFNNVFFKIILWHLNEIDVVRIEDLKDAFAFFKPEDQITVIKKIFWHIEKRHVSFSIEDLIQLVNEESFDQLDLSTYLILHSILNFKKEGKFLFMGEILKIVYKSFPSINRKNLRFHSYFEKCQGRMSYSFNPEQNGTITKIVYPNNQNQFYYAIEFDYDLELLSKVQALPKSRFNKEAKHWGVLSKYSKEIIEFARRNNFLMYFDEDKAKNNTHLLSFERQAIPNGIVFCNGRLASNKMINRKFWWCVNNPCFQNCEGITKNKKWENYSLLDFLNILGFNTNEMKTKPLDLVIKGKYYKYITLINRLNNIFNKMYCFNCDEILHPFKTSHYAAYNVVQFNCLNSVCDEFKKKVYLNHCLNNQCNSLIDSRISKQCPNGLYICSNCGGCCSNKSFKRRLDNLLKADDMNNSSKRWIFEETKRKFDSELGHLEKEIYFCHVDGNRMSKSESDIQECICGNKYDVNIYKKSIYR